MEGSGNRRGGGGGGVKNRQLKGGGGGLRQSQIEASWARIFESAMGGTSVTIGSIIYIDGHLVR